ncbi:YbjN domain-containing protein [Chryseobacterium oryctis]|uniref:YbjN domain-containing protein n=1 Tax=Chryseobacterium oryctis TaxID=2952618 RepID=A0ABT3HL32_9FLAO|nr:YbjN domain-containing protein [Chryseobacterium oryctis]MCW3160505.1 YbjN domain-containing protein [Chryseobacterium oryctis]
MNFEIVEKYIRDLDYSIVHQSSETGVFVIENQDDGIRNLIVGIAPPVIIFEQYLFTINNDNMEMFKSLLMKNRDMIHGAFAITEDGSKVIFRYTLQIHNLDFNEFEAALNSLSLMISEYYEQLIEFSKL